MPAAAANFFASTANVNPPSASQAPKPKSNSSSTDFSGQLKDAQQSQTQTETQPKPKQDTKLVRREVTKSTSSKKARGKAKPQTDDQPAEPVVQKKPTTDAAAPVQLPPEASNGQDDSPPDSDEHPPTQSTSKAVDDGDVNAATQLPAGLVMTPPITADGEPAPTQTQARGEKLRFLPPPSRAIPYQIGGKAVTSPKQMPVATHQSPTAPQQPVEVPDAKDPKGFAISNLDASDQPAADVLDAAAPAAGKSAAKIVAAQAVATAADPVATFAGDAGSTSTIPIDSQKVTSDDPIDISAAISVTPHLASAHTNAPQATGSGDVQPPPQETQFAQANHANIVSDVKTALMPHGGTMRIRLDPPELGALQVNVEVRNGAVNATFQTSNDDATRLLSHSLGQLKTALESQGVTVDKIQVQQSPKNQDARNDTSQQQQQQRDDTQARQNQRDEQRREMLQKMWAKVSGQQMPVDLVA